MILCWICLGFLCPVFSGGTITAGYPTIIQQNIPLHGWKDSCFSQSVCGIIYQVAGAWERGCCSRRKEKVELSVRKRGLIVLMDFQRKAVVHNQVRVALIESAGFRDIVPGAWPQQCLPAVVQGRDGVHDGCFLKWCSLCFRVWAHLESCTRHAGSWEPSLVSPHNSKIKYEDLERNYIKLNRDPSKDAIWDAIWETG